MLVYILINSYPYEGDTTKGVFSTMEKAKEAFNKINKDNKYLYKKLKGHEDIHEWYYKGNSNYDFYQIDIVHVDQDVEG